MSFEHYLVGDVHVLAPTKNLLGQEETVALRGAVQGVAAGGTPKVVIDLGKIAFINSIGLGSLVGMMTTCKTRGGTFVVARADDRINSIFAKTKIALIMDIRDTIEDAVAVAGNKAAA